MNEKTKYITKRWSDKREREREGEKKARAFWRSSTSSSGIVTSFFRSFFFVFLDDQKAKDESHFLVSVRTKENDVKWSATMNET